MAAMQTYHRKKKKQAQSKLSKEEVYYIDSLLEENITQGTKENSLQSFYVIKQFAFIRKHIQYIKSWRY